MRNHIVAALALSLAPLCGAQTIGPERVIAVGADGLSHQECLIEVNPFDSHEVAVVWQVVHQGITGPTLIHYAVSFDGATFTAPAQLPFATGSGSVDSTFDPFIGASRENGDIWVGGAEERAAGQRVFLGRKGAGASTISPEDIFAVHADPIALHKAWLAIGPRPGDTAETMYTSYAITTGTGSLWTARCSDAAPLGTAWNSPIMIEAPGPLAPLSTATVVVRDGPAAAASCWRAASTSTCRSGRNRSTGATTGVMRLPLIRTRKPVKSRRAAAVSRPTGCGAGPSPAWPWTRTTPAWSTSSSPRVIATRPTQATSTCSLRSA